MRVVARVLIVDDSPEICMMDRYILQLAGYNIEGEIADGMTALAHLRASRYPLIVITGHAMPGISGLELLEIVARDVVLRTRHVYVMITANEHIRDAPVLRELNVPYRVKPVRPSELLSVVAEVACRLPPEN